MLPEAEQLDEPFELVDAASQDRFALLFEEEQSKGVAYVRLELSHEKPHVRFGRVDGETPGLLEPPSASL